jgi:hypothetical protein
MQEPKRRCDREGESRNPTLSGKLLYNSNEIEYHLTFAIDLCDGIQFLVFHLNLWGPSCRAGGVIAADM